jgi:RHS repeat-associated protein
VETATGKVTEYVWDYRNRLTSVLFKDAQGAVAKTIDYLYDVDNQRIGKRIDGAVTERYVLDRNQIALVFDGNGNQTHRYLYGTQIDQVLADEAPARTLWALGDNQGTIRDLIDNGGNLVEHLTYDSFGKVISTPITDFRYGYTGREQDSETGLDYYRARYYDAANGKFISEDPIGFEAGDGNLSRYVGNSPTNFIDPDGNRRMPAVRFAPRNLPRNFPGTGTPSQPGINFYRRNIPGSSNYNNYLTPGYSNYYPNRSTPICVAPLGQSCTPEPPPRFDPITGTDNTTSCPNPNSVPRKNDDDQRKDRIKVYRVESTKNQRVVIMSGGRVSIINDDYGTLFINFGDRAEAEKALRERLLSYPNTPSKIKSFDVPRPYFDEVQAMSVPERLSNKTRANRFKPIRVHQKVRDENGFQTQFGLKTQEQFDRLRAVIIQGSGQE